MKSKFLTLSDNEIDRTKQSLAKIINFCKNKIEVINNTNINDFASNSNEYIKKYKNLFIISNKESELLDLKINLKDLSSLIDNIDFQIKFENCRITFADSWLEDKTKIKQNLYFSNCDFTAIELKNICFENFEISGYKYRNERKKSIIFNACEFKELYLNNSTFSENIKFLEKTKIECLYVELNKFSKYFFIQDCVIGNINLWKNDFTKRCYFVDSKFGYERDENNKTKLNFSNANFKDNAYFNNSKFYNYADFHECEFEKIACFYGVTFDKAPNFSQVIFKGNLNVINTNLNFTFDDLKTQIEEEQENFNKDKNEQNKKSLNKFANDFRDSFRVFKNALIKENNLLEASNFHKYELYCKEIELKQNQSKKDEYVENVIDTEKNMWRVRELVDFLLLGFYRKLCDHHTDVFKVFNNLILLVALYVLFSSSFIWVHSDKLKDTRVILTVYEFFDGFHSYVDRGVVIFLLLGCMFTLYKLKAYESKNNILNKQEINFIYIINDFWNFIKSLFLAVFIPCIFYVILGQIFTPIFNLDKYSLFVNILFVSLYICVVYTKSLFFGRYVVLILSYMYFFVILIEQPSVIHPLIGKITNEPDKNFNYPSLMTLYILYTILIALVIFSLQKTARKNSIVPS
ncbi:pentapeptide repeat-containing protein [Campylobacter sp. RM16704]|uniref:pentapeptide repeat-containing protein n=1 Tax=Campylobacter sp. RM16704 TaxID=1500960 RepID=UPI000581C621|nr:pentapeptide repeat-containing protein [Campylobacter sp. RM16704]AJC86904.1 putative membrane protein [Campylobacter sp. RM16704]